jgi:hypothetical protein
MMELLTNFDNVFSELFKDPKAAVLTMKMHTGSHPLILLNHTAEAASDKLILAHFSLHPIRGQLWRTWTNHREGNHEDGLNFQKSYLSRDSVPSTRISDPETSQIVFARA